MLTTEIYFQTPEVGNREYGESTWIAVLIIISPSAAIFRIFSVTEGGNAQSPIDFAPFNNWASRTRLWTFAFSSGQLIASSGGPMMPSTLVEPSIGMHTDGPNV